jgi:tetratricopeptide (TPR) repeat protein
MTRLFVVRLECNPAPHRRWRLTRARAALTAFVACLLFAGTVRAQEVVADSVYLAAMNAGYGALRAADTTRAIAEFERASLRLPGAAAPHLEIGYLLLAQGRRREAASRFEEGLARDHRQDAARRQLGYLYADLARPEAALQVFSWLRDEGRAIPQDHYAIGVLSAQLQRWASARGAYDEAARLAAAAGDTVLVRSARAGAASVATFGVGGGRYVELYLAPFYQDRFDNTVGLGFLRAGIRGGSWWQPAAYLSVRATRDSRSTGGQQPILFNDNTVIPAVGVRVTPGGGPLALYAEAGAAWDLVDRPERGWRRDLRAGGNVTWQGQLALADGARGPALVTDVNADATWYERFGRNVIAFGLVREAVRIRPTGGALALDLYARGWGAYDSRGDFFNRVVEGGGGIAVHLPGPAPLSVYIDVLRGRYLEPVPVSAGLPRVYDDWRVTMSTGFFRFRPARP